MRLLHLRKNYIITMHKSHREKEERDMSGEDRRKGGGSLTRYVDPRCHDI